MGPLFQQVDGDYGARASGRWAKGGGTVMVMHCFMLWFNGRVIGRACFMARRIDTMFIQSAAIACQRLGLHGHMLRPSDKEPHKDKELQHDPAHVRLLLCLMPVSKMLSQFKICAVKNRPNPLKCRISAARLMLALSHRQDAPPKISGLFLPKNNFPVFSYIECGLCGLNFHKPLK
jgi:hypothetical protein